MRKSLKYGLMVLVLSFITLSGIVWRTSYVKLPPSITCGPATLSNSKTLPVQIKAGAPFRSTITDKIRCSDITATAFGPTWGDYGRLFGTWQLYADWLVCGAFWSGIAYVYISRKARQQPHENLRD